MSNMKNYMMDVEEFCDGYFYGGDSEFTIDEDVGAQIEAGRQRALAAAAKVGAKTIETTAVVVQKKKGWSPFKTGEKE